MDHFRGFNNSPEKCAPDQKKWNFHNPIWYVSNALVIQISIALSSGGR